jgi:UDP-N-acetylglucosamine--N-acetylmuramyl-(pentapeptide) pyrophosphoryl-undecaprenol N-acetylglucosamine transferase
MSSNPKPLRLVIACGGTGGHLFPGIAVAQCARRRGHECLVLISEKQIDALATQGHTDLQYEKLPAIAMPPVFSLRMVKFGFRLWKTVRAAKKILTQFKADAVLGMGGFTSLPPIYAARKMRLKALVHESNAIPGKANKLSARYCDRILLGLADCAAHFPQAKTRVVGTPLRESLRLPVDPQEAWQFFGLQPGKSVVLIMGGSQGARGVNDNVCAALQHLDPDTVQFIHLSGPAEIDKVRAAYSQTKFSAHVAPFCQRMDLAYSLAAIAISRSGASSLTELSAFGVPTILIPFPHAADDHQTRNAEVFVRAQAALMVQERDLTGQRLAALIGDLCRREEVRLSLKANMQQLAVPDAAVKVCESVEELFAR